MVNMVHNNYNKITSEEKQHIDNMFTRISQYADDEKISLAYDDRAERLIEALATYIVESKKL
jgi:hypothetical protein